MFRYVNPSLLNKQQHGVSIPRMHRLQRKKQLSTCETLVSRFTLFLALKWTFQQAGPQICLRKEKSEKLKKEAEAKVRSESPWLKW